MRSYAGNFLVVAPDTTTAAEAAKLAELTREAVFNLLGHDGEWTPAASIHLRARTVETAAGETELWTILVSRGEFAIAREGIYPNKRNDVMVLQVVHLCLEDVAGRVGPENRTSPAAIPLWLSCGVAENLSRENVARQRESVSDVVKAGKFFPIGRLFEASNLPADDAQRELFFKESGSVVDFLLHREDGGVKLRQAIVRFRAEGDFMGSLLVAFSGDFGSIAELEKRWKEFAVERAERTIGAPRMLLSETKEALDRVLTVSISVIDRDTLEEKVITTDLWGLFRHRNKIVVRRIASQKQSEVFELSLKARPEYAPVLQQYLQALSAIVENDRAAFRSHLARAERLRKALEKTSYFKVEAGEHDDTDNQ